MPDLSVVLLFFSLSVLYARLQESVIHITAVPLCIC